MTKKIDSLLQDLTEVTDEQSKTIQALNEQIKTMTIENNLLYSKNTSLKKYTDYTFEKNKLKSILGDYLYNKLKKYNLVIAGGTITSLFTNSEINDLDVYGRCNEDILEFATDIIENSGWIVSHTKKATQFTYENNLVQLIHYSHYEDIDTLFNSFDFTVCMGAYDFKTEEFVFHPDFLKHNSQRLIKFNSGTSYPIVSALRVQKYENKGYKISKPEYIRIMMTCMNLNISSYDELKDHLGGLYGISYDLLFDDIKDEKFDLLTAIDKISNITLSEDYFTTPKLLDISVEEVLEDIDKSIRTIIKHRGNNYRAYKSGRIEKVKKLKNTDIIVDIKETIPFNKIYKFVRKDKNGIYRSYHDDSFVYSIGDETVAKGSIDGGWGKGGRLHFNLKEEIEDSPFHKRSDNALIEAEFNVDDLIDIETDDAITVTKAKILREIPKSEWNQWIHVESKKPTSSINDSNILF